jgi:adenylyltransferase/sulfurtransferase
MAAFWVLKDSLLFLITGKNLRDLFPEPPSSKDVPNCSFNGVLGTLPGMMGTMMAHETLKLIIGLPTLKNELVFLKH